MTKQLAIDFSRYPESPGYKKRGTSERAARKMLSRSKELQLHVLEILSIEGKTTWELCEELNDPRMRSVPPRVSQLIALGKVKDSGFERLTGSQNEAAVWEITEAGRQYILELRRMAG